MLFGITGTWGKVDEEAGINMIADITQWHFSWTITLLSNFSFLFT